MMFEEAEEAGNTTSNRKLVLCVHTPYMLLAQKLTLDRAQRRRT